MYSFKALNLLSLFNKVREFEEQNYQNHKNIKNVGTDLLMRLLLSSKSAVTLLPEELPGPEEGLGVFELPPHHVTPLV